MIGSTLGMDPGLSLGMDSVEEETFPEDNGGKETLTLRRYLISQFNYNFFSFKNVLHVYEKEKIEKPPSQNKIYFADFCPSW